MIYCNDKQYIYNDIMHPKMINLQLLSGHGACTRDLACHGSRNVGAHGVDLLEEHLGARGVRIWTCSGIAISEKSYSLGNSSIIAEIC